MTIKNKTKARAKAIRLYREGKIPAEIFLKLAGDIVAGHSRKKENINVTLNAR